MVFQFEHVALDHGPGGKWDIRPPAPVDVKAGLSRWQAGPTERGWNSLEQSRPAASRLAIRGRRALPARVGQATRHRAAPAPGFAGHLSGRGPGHDERPVHQGGGVPGQCPHPDASRRFAGRRIHHGPAVVDGNFTMPLPDDPVVHALTRRPGRTELLVVANVGSDSRRRFPAAIPGGRRCRRNRNGWLRVAAGEWPGPGRWRRCSAAAAWGAPGRPTRAVTPRTIIDMSVGPAVGADRRRRPVGRSGRSILRRVRRRADG